MAATAEVKVKIEPNPELREAVVRLLNEDARLRKFSPSKHVVRIPIPVLDQIRTAYLNATDGAK